jgi:hypothetical protein
MALNLAASQHAIIHNMVFPKHFAAQMVDVAGLANARSNTFT